MKKDTPGGEDGRDPSDGGATSGTGNGASAEVSWDHAVQFYDTDDFLCDSVATFLTDGLIAGEPLVVLATPDHRDGVIERLEGNGLSWEAASRDGRLHWMDAREALGRVMVDDLPDPARFDTHVGEFVRAGRGSHTGRVRAYGELVDLLWREGNADAALRLEDMWNDLGRRDQISLLCAYSRGNVYRETRDIRIRQVCERHATVHPPQSAY